MTAYDNKNLIVTKSIKLTPTLEKVLKEIDSYWEGKKETVTSGLRDEEDQLRIIRKYLTAKGLKYPEAMTCKVTDKVIVKGEERYAWQEAWSALLNKGVIINPPYPAACLMDYWRGGVNKKGLPIGQSPHTRGRAFDISGTDSLPIVEKLLKDKKIKSYLLERENNCIHIDCF